MKLASSPLAANFKLRAAPIARSRPTFVTTVPENNVPPPLHALKTGPVHRAASRHLAASALAPHSGDRVLESPNQVTPRTSRLPVTVLSGFLGAGKTTLLKRILLNNDGLRICVIVNDVANFNVDEELLLSAPGGPRITQAQESLVALSNGCICCSIREDLVLAVQQLAEGGNFDYLVVESTGVSVPMPIAATFEMDSEEGGVHSLKEVAYLDTLVTVVDAQRFVSKIMEAKYLQDVGMAVDQEDDRTIADLLVEQVELANVLVLNKTDLITADELEQLKLLLRKLNTTAKIIPTAQCQVPMEEILNTRMYNPGVAQEAPGWMQEINAFEADRIARSSSHSHSSTSGQGHSHSGGDHSDEHDHGEHSHLGHAHRETEMEKYHISSFVYFAQKPFHPSRLLETALSKTWAGVLRTKGFFWLATRHDVMGIWHSAGGAWQGEPGARWAAATKLSGIDDPTGSEHANLKAMLLDNAEQESDRAGWHDVWGDRCQQIVWIGVGMDEGAITTMLDSCLLTVEEMALGPQGWAEQFEDPLPAWEVAGVVGEMQETEEGEESDA